MEGKNAAFSRNQTGKKGKKRKGRGGIEDRRRVKGWGGGFLARCVHSEIQPRRSATQWPERRLPLEETARSRWQSVGGGRDVSTQQVANGEACRKNEKNPLLHDADVSFSFFFQKHTKASFSFAHEPCACESEPPPNPPRMGTFLSVKKKKRAAASVRRWSWKQFIYLAPLL